MTPPRLSTLLKQHNAGYVLVRPPGQRFRTRQGERVATGKEPVRGGWQKSPVSLSEALDWARRGGNVGLLGGSGGLILLDADANADQVVAAEPRLRETVRIFRQNATNRAKWIVRIDGDLPPSAKQHGVLEVLAAGTQGVIVGRHASGARIEHAGDHIVTLTIDDVRRLWRKMTGEELGYTRRPEDAPPPDAEAVQRSMALAERVLELGGVEHAAWREYEGGRKAVLHKCPFNPPDDPHPDDEAAVIVIGADGRIGATCHHARCQERIQQAGGGWTLLKELVGYTPEPTPDHERARTQIEYLREYVRTTDFAEHVPLTKQAINGYRTRDTDVAVADAILDIAHLHGRLTGLVLPWRKLRLLTNLGSVNTAGKALDRLTDWFVVEEPQRDDGLRRYSIHPSLIAWTEEQIDVAQIARNIAHIENTTHSDNMRAIYATSPLTTHRSRDAFTSTLRPMTEEELQRRIDERQERIAAGEDVKPIEPRRYRRRLAALLPALGRAALRLIDALATSGGQVERKTLREYLNLSSSSLSRAVARAAELGLVSADRRTVKLHEQWSDLVDAFEPYMPTAGRAVDREISDLNAAIRYAQKQSRQKDADHRRLERRIMRCKRRKQELAALQRPDLRHRHADQATLTAYETVALRRLQDRHAQARLDLAAQRHADDWRLLAEVRRLRNDGVGKRDAWRMLETAGWTRTELYSVMAVLWPSRESHAWAA